MLINQFLLLGAVLFCIGVYGVIARKNAVMVLMAVELILNSVNLNLLAFAMASGTADGHTFALYIIAVAAAEVGVGLALVLLGLPQPALHRARRAQRDEGMSVLSAANLFAAQLLGAADDGHGEEAAHEAAGAAHDAVVQSAGWFLEHAYLIPIVPAVAFWLIILFGKRIPDVKLGKLTIPGGGSMIGLASMVTSLVLAVGTAVQWIQRVDDTQDAGAVHALARFGRTLLPAAEEEGGHALTYVQPVIRQWTWWQSGGVHFSFGEYIDGLAVVMLLLVAFISTLVQIFSLEYLKGDRRYTHFFAALTLFSAGMLAMVLAPEHGPADPRLGDHGPVLVHADRALVGGRGQQPCRAQGVLHGPRRRHRPAGRHGDPARRLGHARHRRHQRLGRRRRRRAQRRPHRRPRSRCSSPPSARAASSRCTPGCPTRWPGPTPVSSLLHSSTMVVAGVFLVARLYPVFFEGLNIMGSSVNLIAVIGGITIIIAAVLAFVQNDIKKVLAYSTVSQLGYMMMGLGVGAYTPAVFHVFTHAFFKCCLFLCAGSVSHSGAGHSFDMKENMGGLYKKMPVTAWCWLISYGRAVWRAVRLGLLLEGRDHRLRRSQQLQGLLGDRSDRRVHDGRLHDPGHLPGLLRQGPRRGRPHRDDRSTATATRCTHRTSRTG